MRGRFLVLRGGSCLAEEAEAEGEVEAARVSTLDRRERNGVTGSIVLDVEALKVAVDREVPVRIYGVIGI